MMNDILKQIKAGEVSGVQFKERILDKYDVACELVAFSNSHGGKLVVGIKDKTGETNALSYSEVQVTTNLLSDIASENVVPSILIKIDTVEVGDGNLVVAAMLLFGKYTQRWMPMMTAKCICFAGNSIGSKVFRDKVNDADMEGNLLHQYDTIMDFFTRNLHNVQVGDEFNSMGKLEIPYTSLVEFTVNSLVHRSLNMKAPVRIFIFDNRVEIHSPGALPNGLTIDDIKAGTSMPRNMFLFNNAIYLLPYTGVGSGITRALDEDINVTFMNNDKAQEFVITVWRGKSNQVEDKSNQVGNQVEQKSNEVEGKSNEVEGKSNQVQDSDTKKVSLSNRQRDIVNFCSVPRTTAEIMERLGLSNQTKNRERYITSLVTAGYLQMTNPDNPTASNQKYKKVNIR